MIQLQADTFTPMQSRVFGLDLMRATAIVLVVFWHSADAFRDFALPSWMPPYVDGVDLFFVLSGFLIGGILLKQGAREGIASWRLLLDFLQRRWLRTLPNYYLFLAANIVLAAGGITVGVVNHNTWAYAFFLQNLYKPVDLFFWESWSLVVEEWFYLVFALFLFACIALGQAPRKAFVIATALMIIAPLALRFHLAPEVSSKWQLDQGVRMLATTRVDSIGWGVLAAWLASAAPTRWRAARWPAFAAGLAGMLTNSLFYDEAWLRYSSTLFFTVNAISMALLLPLLSSWARAPRWGAPVVFTSLISYALYLVHQPVRAMFNRLWHGADRPEGLLLLALYWITCFAISWLVYRFWEKRFMDMRAGVSGRLGVDATLNPPGTRPGTAGRSHRDSAPHEGPSPSDTAVCAGRRCSGVGPR
jgi:peptidoglycan/LPS O-acetylase OafA/YrhL